MKCPSCNKGTLNREQIKEDQLGVNLGIYEGFLCNHCGESFFDEKVTQQILKKSKEIS